MRNMRLFTSGFRYNPDMSNVIEPVLILGAGINGAAIARELAINGVPLRIVEQRDLASGTTAYSSRLIHGGLRYLEFGELDLVRESLAERTHWLQYAPDFVRPLRLLIPVTSRAGGFLAGARRFFGWKPRKAASEPRGLWMIRLGLRMYDWYAHDRTLPRHRVHRSDAIGMPAVDRRKYRWLCEFSDAQMLAPERFTVALLADARAAAAERGSLFELLTYHTAELQDKTAIVTSNRRDANDTSSVSKEIRWSPSAIINATGAWVDQTLAQIAPRESALKQRIAGTQGTHLLSWHPGLRQALGDFAFYGEADDGRPVFILPFGDATLIGTTDEPFSGNPDDARASQTEIEYLLATVNATLPSVKLSLADIGLHYCGVRPLPHTDATTTAAITRRHWLEEHQDCAVPTYSVIGGKLTTCRSLAQQTAQTLLETLQLPRVGSSQARPLPGAEQVAVVFDSAGCLNAASIESVRQLIADEWVTTLEDLVERRLMLHFDQRLSVRCLEQLAKRLVASCNLRDEQVGAAVASYRQRLAERFGRNV